MNKNFFVKQIHKFRNITIEIRYEYGAYKEYILNCSLKEKPNIIEHYTCLRPDNGLQVVICGDEWSVVFVGNGNSNIIQLLNKNGFTKEHARQIVKLYTRGYQLPVIYNKIVEMLEAQNRENKTNNYISNEATTNKAQHKQQTKNKQKSS